MPVVFDEVSATVEPPAPAPAAEATEPAGAPPDSDPHRLRAVLRRLEERAARLRAD